MTRHRTRVPGWALLITVAAALVSGCAGTRTAGAPDDLQAQVTAAELAFARSMAERNHAAFTSFIADEAVFFADASAQRGKAAVAAAWRPFFEGSEAPFSWEPDTVEVLDSGTLALSSGPVYDPAGRIIGRFNSIWRREGPGEWRVVFDRGSPVCGTSASGAGGSAPQ